MLAEFYIWKQLRRVDDKENSVFKCDGFLMSIQQFK